MRGLEKEDLLIKEISEKYNISRIMLQRYERLGLVKSTGKNKMGHLKYNKRMVNKILLIRFLQECYFTLPEIKKLLLMTNDEFIHELSLKMLELENRRLDLELQITKTINLLKKLSNDDYSQISDLMEEYR